MSKRLIENYALTPARRCLAMVCCLLLPGFLSAQELKILSSIEPVNKLVAAIAKDNHDREVIWKKNQSVHNVSFKPSQIRQIADADIVFWVGPMLETALAPLLLSEDRNNKSRRLANQDVRYLKGGEYVSTEVCQWSWHVCDPHIWFDSYNALKMADQIATVLIDLDPKQKAFYESNLEKFQLALSERQRQARSKTSPVILVLHNGWQYLAKEHDLAGYQTLSDHGLEYVGVHTALELEENLINPVTDCVLAGPTTRLDLLKGLIKDQEQGPSVLVLDPMGSDFSKTLSFHEYLESTLQSLLGCELVTR